MAATQRFVMLVDPDERVEWGERAAKAGLTTAQFLRKAARSFDPDAERYRQELEALLPEANAAIDNMRASFAEMRATLRHALDPQRDVEARERIAASITDEDVEVMRLILGESALAA